MLHVNSSIPAIAELTAQGFSLEVGHDATLPTIGLLNLMPKKAETEQDFCRMLAASGVHLNLVLLKIPHQHYKTIPQEYVDAHYVDFAPHVFANQSQLVDASVGDFAQSKVDALIITGAPLEQMPFEEVRYWQQLQRIWDWTVENAIPTLNICWAAQAALYHFYGIHKRSLPEKCFGIFPQRNLAPQHPLLAELGATFPMPHSRHTELFFEHLPDTLELLADSRVGQSIFCDATRHQTFVTGHLEYKADTLDGEYRRDLAKGLSIAPPIHYYIGDNPNSGIDFSWEKTAQQFYSNWIKLAVSGK